MERIPNAFMWSSGHSVSTGLSNLSRELFDTIQIKGMAETTAFDNDGKPCEWHKSINYGGKWNPITMRYDDTVALVFRTYEPPIVSTTEGQDEKAKERS